MRSNVPLIIIACVLLVALGGGIYFYRSAQQELKPANANLSNDAANRLPPGAQPPHVRGDANASVVIEEFGDFQCPLCGRVYPVIKKIEGDYGRRIGVIFRNRPLTDIHPNALNAAHAAEAAGMQNAFWEMHDLLYESQDKWAKSADVRPIFADYARQLNLDVDKFKRDMDSTEVSNRIIQDERRGDALHVNGTPTIFVNGQEVKNYNDLAIRAAIDAALQAKK